MESFRPFEIRHPGMRAFSVVVLKLIDVIKEIMARLVCVCLFF